MLGCGQADSELDRLVSRLIVRQRATMNTRRYSCFVVPLLLGLGAQSLTAQGPDTLSHRDLSVRGLGDEGDTATAHRMLGPPLRVVQNQGRNEDGALLLDWYYHDFTISFDEGRRYFVEVTGASVSTNRGVRVGDSEAKVRRLYGRPTQQDVGHLLYAASTSDAETRGITFFLAGGRVKRILVGHVISVE